MNQMHASYASQTLLTLHLQKLEWNKRSFQNFSAQGQYHPSQVARDILGPPSQSVQWHTAPRDVRRIGPWHRSVRVLSPLVMEIPWPSCSFIFIHFPYTKYCKIMQDPLPWVYDMQIILPDHSPATKLSKQTTDVYRISYQIKFMFISPSAETSLA